MRRLAAFAFVCCALAACDGLLGIEKLQVVGEPDETDPEPREAGPSKPRDAGLDMGVEETGPVVDASADYKRVFVSGRLFDSANLGGAEGANQKCQDLATAAKLDGRWVAWISTAGKKAIDNLTFDGPYQLLNGKQIAPNKAGLLKGSLETAINVHENGGGYNGADLKGAWTGTRKNGDVGLTCSDWTSASGSAVGTAANPIKSDGHWTDMGGATVLGFGTDKGWFCSLQGRLYCFEL